MDKSLMMLLYVLGWGAAFYLGMIFESWYRKKHYQADLDRAYKRGWKAGHEFVDRVKTQQLDADSAVRILTGEDDGSDL